jgi:hypothetical protein
MERKRAKKLTRMGNQMDYGLVGMRMDRRRLKELTKMEKKMD